MKRLLLLFVVCIALTACGPSEDEIRATIAAEDAATEVAFAATEAARVIHVFTGFGFSIEHPEGWLAETRLTVTIISELEEDHDHAFGDPFPRAGYQVFLDHRDVPFMQSIGLPENATLDDLLELNINEFDWQVSDVLETEIFGVPALRVKYDHDNENGAHVFYMGFIEGEAFLFGLGAPSEDAIDEFMPTWEKMIESIESVEE